MSTAKFDTLSNLAGSRTVPVDTVAQGTAKAWVNFNGTGTVAIRAAFNVSSITDNGTGDYTVNFTNALVDANYSVLALTGGFGSGNSPIAFYESTSTARTASLVRLYAHQAGGFAIDGSFESVAIFR